MSKHHTWLSVVAVVAWAAAIYAGCAASETRGDDDTTAGPGSGGAGGGTGGDPSSGGNPSTGGSLTVGSGGAGGSMGCADFTAEAYQKPAAMLVVLDMTASMTTGNKWSSAQLAIVNALDKAAFDHMQLGLVTFPVSFSSPPACVCNYLYSQYGGILCNTPTQCCNLVIPGGVSCGVSGLPQVAMADSGTDKSNAASGVRKNIYDYLVTHQPQSNDDDGSPIYEALVAGYGALDLAQNVDERLLILITDGGFSCASLSSRGGYTDDYGCQDWEHPDNVNALITAERTDPTTPIKTFVVGVPGSDSTGQPQGVYATPPYNMLLALSTYAVSGSPTTVDPTCDSSAVFSQGGPAPAVPCHFDMTNGNFNTNALADTVAAIRGQALGCVYPLPDPPMGETIDADHVNVEITVEGITTPIPRRSNPSDPCTTAPGCWDYNVDGDIVILGHACDALSGATQGKVDIVAGCETVLN